MITPSATQWQTEGYWGVGARSPRRSENADPDSAGGARDFGPRAQAEPAP